MSDVPPPAELPERIGEFRILRVLGEGGMGRVYLARQEHPQRDVALKLVAGAAISSGFQKRFQREIELMASLEHPGIARLYSTGSVDTPTGALPYLAMEHVRGTDLLTHAHRARLGLHDKLRLLARVCEAVHYAHTRGVIHRDLKPGNILVDEGGQPKVLDFGVAHMTGRDDVTQMTVAGEILGTVPYMPLEQLAGKQHTVDPRWDVYALGVIAYQLIGGELPYPGLVNATVLTALNEVRTSTPVRLGKLFPAARGDIETVVMKAMAAEAPQRYGSAAELAADLDRITSNLPIAARPPTVRYVLGLFVRRHRALATGAALAIVAIIAGAAISLRFALAEAERAAEAQAVSDFLEHMIASADPERALGDALTVRQVVTSAQNDLASEPLSPIAAARLQRLLGMTQGRLGEADVAIAALERAVAMYATATGADSTETRETKIDLATVLREKGQYARAQTEMKALLATLPDDADTLRLRLSAQHVLAQSIAEDGKLAEAQPLMKRTYDEAVARLGAEDAQTLSIGHDQGEVLSEARQMPEAVALLQHVADARAKLLGDDHPQALASRNALAGALFRAGDAAKAETMLRDVAARREHVLGSEHIATLTAKQNVAVALIQLGQQAEGLQIAEGVLPAVKKYFGPEHRRTIGLMNIVAYAQEDLGRVDQAEATYREILRVIELQGTADEPDHLSFRNNLAMLLTKAGRLDEARPVFEDVRARATRALPPDHPYQGIFAGNYGEYLLAAKQPRAALPLLEQSLAAARKDFGEDHPRTKKARDRLERAHQALAHG